MKRQLLAGLCAVFFFLLPGGVFAASPAAQAAGTWVVAPKTRTVNQRLPAALYKAKPEIHIQPDRRGSLSFIIKKKGKKKRETYKGRLAFKPRGHLTVTSRALRRFHLKSVTGRYKLSSPYHNQLTLSYSGEKIVLIRKGHSPLHHSGK